MLQRQDSRERNRNDDDESCQGTCQTNVEQSPARRHWRLHPDECAKGARQQSGRLRNEEGECGIDAIVATKKVMAEFMRGQDGQQRSRELQSRRQHHRMSERLPNELADAPKVVPGDQHDRAVKTAALGGCSGGCVCLRAGAPDNS